MRLVLFFLGVIEVVNAPRPTVVRTHDLAMSVPAHWSYSSSEVKRDDVWSVVTAGTQGSSANRGTWISLSNAKIDWAVPSDEKIIETLQRWGRSIDFHGPVPNRDDDHVDKLKWGGQTWFVREQGTGDRVFQGTAYRGKKLYSLYARVEPAHLDEVRKILQSIRIR
jgi:hypothetical protein